MRRAPGRARSRAKKTASPAPYRKAAPGVASRQPETAWSNTPLGSLTRTLWGPALLGAIHKHIRFDWGPARRSRTRSKKVLIAGALHCTAESYKLATRF